MFHWTLWFFAFCIQKATFYIEQTSLFQCVLGQAESLKFEGVICYSQRNGPNIRCDKVPLIGVLLVSNVQGLPA
jgi:hypothetical protein